MKVPQLLALQEPMSDPEHRNLAEAHTDAARRVGITDWAAFYEAPGAFLEQRASARFFPYLWELRNDLCRRSGGELVPDRH